MLLYLTNANPDHRLKPIMIHSANILSMTRDETRGITFLFMPPHGTWEVCETIEEIYSQLRMPLLYKICRRFHKPKYNPHQPEQNVIITPVDPATGEATGDPIIQPITPQIV
jgi:hypothetical protein